MLLTERLRTIDAPKHIGQRIRLQGWLHARRRMGGITFVVLRDGWGTLQAVVEGAEGLKPLQETGATVESVISIEGKVVAAPQAPHRVELHNIQIEVISSVTEPPSIPLNKQTLSAQMVTLLDQATFLNRHPQRRAIFRISALAMAGFRQYLDTLGFTEIQTPKIVAAASESGANVFELDYFGRSAYLAQSPQMYKQIMVGVFERVYEIGPVFRAEPHDSTRHLNEYISLDVECGFIENHFTLMTLLRDVLATILDTIQQRAQEELTLLNVQVPVVPETIPHIDFRAAQELIFQLHGVDVRSEPDLSGQDERWLGEWAQQEFGSDFLFVTGYPMSKRPFYTHPDPSKPGASNSFDLLFRGTELVTGGQRLHRYQDYMKSLTEAKLSIEPFRYYLEAFRYGMPPHGGFAIGLERLLTQLLGLSSVKLAALFPRDIQRLTP